MDVPSLAGWENFYVITGSSAGGLIGLTFVVIALIGEAHRARPMGLRAFVTPTVVHFGVVLALAAYLSVPHHSALSLSLGFGVIGVAGLVFCVMISASVRDQGSDYVPIREDWAFNVILPIVVYAALGFIAVTVWFRPAASLYGAAAASLMLLFIGIHNAWDIAVFLTMARTRERK